ncbi:MAG: cytochrome C [Steroidobacteraceae bacterium]
MTLKFLGSILSTGLLLVATTWAASPAAMNTRTIAHGRHLVDITGCNVCHTPGYAAGNGSAPKAALLTGLGNVYVGPWGTSYPINLRLFVRPLTVQQWIALVRNTKAAPPMPWFVFRKFSDYDLASMYYYIRWLGPAGKPTPADLPPGKLPAPPYDQVVIAAPRAAAVTRH